MPITRTLIVWTHDGRFTLHTGLTSADIAHITRHLVKRADNDRPPVDSTPERWDWWENDQFEKNPDSSGAV